MHETTHALLATNDQGKVFAKDDASMKQRRDSAIEYAKKYAKGFPGEGKDGVVVGTKPTNDASAHQFFAMTIRDVQLKREKKAGVPEPKD